MNANPNAAVLHAVPNQLCTMKLQDWTAAFRNTLCQVFTRHKRLLDHD